MPRTVEVVTTVSLPVRRPRTLAVTPAVVGHRGASGTWPEHTLEAYRAAIAMGADDIELDLVVSADGVLVVRHESDLARTTDIAARPGLAHRRSTRVVDGEEVTGWFAEDLPLSELRTLRVVERMPGLRPASAAHDGRLPLATLDDVLEMVAAESAARGRSIGVMIELKDAAWSASRGLPLDTALVATLRRHGVDTPRSRVTVMSFEPTILQQLAGQVRVPLVQLLDRRDRRPADLAAAGDPRTFGDLASPAGLALVERYADGVGAHHSLVAAEAPGGRGMRPSTLVADAHREWLTVHVWTLRAENHFLPAPFRRGEEAGERPAAHGDLGGFVELLLELGVDGLITDQPDAAVAAREAWLAPVGVRVPA